MTTTRNTRPRDFTTAITHAALLAICAGVIAAAMIYFIVYPGHRLEMLKMVAMTTLPIIFVIYTIIEYMRLRTAPTRDELSAREKIQLRALAVRHPDVINEYIHAEVENRLRSTPKSSGEF